MDCDTKFNWIALVFLVMLLLCWKLAIGLLLLFVLISAINAKLDKDLEQIKEEIKNDYRVH